MTSTQPYGGVSSSHHGSPDANHLVQASREAMDMCIETGRFHEGIVEVMLGNLTCPTCTARALAWAVPFLAKSQADMVGAVHGAMIDLLNKFVEFEVPAPHSDDMYTEAILARADARREAEEFVDEGDDGDAD